MAVVTRQRKTGAVYFVANKQNGAAVWERVGTVERDAERRDAAMKKEIAAGTYIGKPTGAKTVGAYAATWLAARTNRNADGDRGQWAFHVVRRCPWFLAIKLEDLRVAHVIALAKELYAPYADKTGQPFTPAPRTITNIFKSVLGPMFRDCRIHDLMVRNVMELPRGTLIHSSKKRKPYDAAAVVALTTDERTSAHWRMMFTLLFYTGARKGEAIGLKFRDWQRDAEPLGALTIDKQYDGAAMKTAVRVGDQARIVPVHPTLAKALEAWWDTGFEQVYCRKPTEDDFIVPSSRDSSRHSSEYGIYEAFQCALRRNGIANLTLHATRNTFISLSRRAGARTDVLERVTHNARGAVIDIYTDFDWQPLCEAVLCFMKGQGPRPSMPVRQLRAV